MDEPEIIAKVLRKSIKFDHNIIYNYNSTTNQWSLINCNEDEEGFYKILQSFIFLSLKQLDDESISILKDSGSGEDNDKEWETFSRHLFEHYLIDLKGGFEAWKPLLSDC